MGIIIQACATNVTCVAIRRGPRNSGIGFVDIKLNPSRLPARRRAFITIDGDLTGDFLCCRS